MCILCQRKAAALKAAEQSQQQAEGIDFNHPMVQLAIAVVGKEETIEALTDKPGESAEDKIYAAEAFAEKIAAGVIGQEQVDRIKAEKGTFADHIKNRQIEISAREAARKKVQSLAEGSVKQTAPTTAPEFLAQAKAHMEDRAATYDNPEGERSMGKTVAAFNAITGKELSETDGWLLMTLLKAVRANQGNFKSDNYEDLTAYAALLGESAVKAQQV